MQVEARTAEVAAMNADLAQLYAEVDGLLASTLDVDDFVDLESLEVSTGGQPPVDPGELATPAALAVAYCRQRGHRRVALLMPDAVKEDFATLAEAAEGVDAVIVGDLGARFAYPVLNRAFRELMDGAELIALQRNRFWRTPDGLSLDVGPFVAALEYAAQTEAVVVGKPSPEFFRTELAGIPAGAHVAAMVGDDVESDVGGAQAAGLAGILVRTGKYRDAVLERSGIRPWAIVDSIADVPTLLRDRAAGPAAEPRNP
jgi:HAD superfamily hydrolase (TIGR01458 family)